mgnify:CR=1 FL=1
MLKYLRIAIQIVSITLLTLLFLDFTGTVQPIFGWMAKVQLFPAIMALNVVVLAILVLMTIVFGRLYCSVICPLGIFQDIFNFIGLKARRNHFHYQGENRWLRFFVLAAFIVSIVMGFTSIACIIEPYSAFGKMVNNLFQPLYRGINNQLALYAEAHDSYRFYAVDNTVASWTMLCISGGICLLLAVLSFFGGRWWCSSICPVGSLLSLVSRFSLLRPVIDTAKCNGCGLCARNCKASCINPRKHEIDMSNCVVCFDCINNCRQGAIKYKLRKCSCGTKKNECVDSSRRNFVIGAVAAGSIMAADAVAKTVDGGLTILEDKKKPMRANRLVPAGAWSVEHFAQHCTACQLCVSNCPNGVLRPSNELEHFMQPEMSYEVGHCRPECTRCSSVCPTGAIKPITREEKSSIQIGHAVWIADNCVVNRDGVSCGNCARHCPTGAITMVGKGALSIPSINAEKCIGCGACEHLCPSRPFSAIYVEGHTDHRTI